jgi:enterochelin esterase-like enzyme
MKKIIILLFAFLSTLISCKSIKSINLKESKYYSDSIYSNSLSEYRKHNIYLPKGFNKNKNYPIIYATDGNHIKENNFIKKSLDSLINNNIIKPIIFIESYCNIKIADSTSTTTGDGKTVKHMFRYFEYVENQTKDKVLLKRFPNHMNYFKNEMMVQIEKKLNQTITKNDRYFYGFSNGGDFGLSLLNKHPELIGTYLCFSSVGMNSSKEWKKDINYPNLYIVYGTEEGEWVSQENEFMKKVYLNSNSFAEIRSFEGGHDYKIWNQELIKLLTKLFSVNNK